MVCRVREKVCEGEVRRLFLLIRYGVGEHRHVPPCIILALVWNRCALTMKVLSRAFVFKSDRNAHSLSYCVWCTRTPQVLSIVRCN